MAWVAVDFGTCNCAAAIKIDKRIHLVSFGYNRNTYPTIAHISSQGVITTGLRAEEYRLQDPENYLWEFKTRMTPTWRLNGVGYREVIADILSKIRETAVSENNGQAIDQTIITVPISFSNASAQRGIIEAAAKDAGFQEIIFMEEPKAAACHYADVMCDRAPSLSLIYDIGGGTFDPALVQIDNQGNTRFLGTPSSVACGGHDFDAVIYGYAQSILTLEREDKKTMYDDLKRCRDLKEQLSSSTAQTTTLSGDQRFELSREKFNELIGSHIDRTIDACDNLLHSAGKNWADLSRILFVGGSTSIPLVRAKLLERLQSYNAGNIPIIRNDGDYNHLFAVCLGAIAAVCPSSPVIRHILIAAMCSDGRLCQLKEGCNTFGRATDNDFVFATDPRMSRSHFRIEVSLKTDGRGYDYLLTDCRSRNGTIVNNTLCLKPSSYPGAPEQVILHVGDAIKAGNTCFKLILPPNN